MSFFWKVVGSYFKAPEPRNWYIYEPKGHYRGTFVEGCELGPMTKSHADSVVHAIYIDRGIRVTPYRK